MIDAKDCIFPESLSIKDALSKIDANHTGWILTVNQENIVTGLVTDGDIRRALIDGLTLDQPIALAANTNFTFAKSTTPREQVLKQLDHSIKFIPMLDGQGRLVSIVSQENFPVSTGEKGVLFRSRAPVRVSFGGGGSDVTHYFSDKRGAVLNSAIGIYSHATLRVRDDSKVIVRSLDLKARAECDDLNAFLKQKSSFGLVQAVLELIKPDFGFELDLNSDFPMGSGLGGSASVAAAILGCFNMRRQDRWDKHQLSEFAFQAERHILKIAGGWQDQYAAVFGGFNFMEFVMEENIVHPLRIQHDILLELEESLILCDTQVPHHSGKIHEDQKEVMQASDVRKLVENNVELSYKMRDYLLRGRLEQFGRSLDQAWQMKRQFSSQISNGEIDQLYAGALDSGAEGGKLLGAGGGGFFMFFVSPFRKHNLMDYIVERGLTPRHFHFDSMGLQSWSTRDRSSGK